MAKNDFQGLSEEEQRLYDEERIFRTEHKLPQITEKMWFFRQRTLATKFGTTSLEVLKKNVQVANTENGVLAGKMRSGTKLEQAISIYEELVAKNESRATIVEAFRKQLGMSKAGAQTYFYNVQKKVVK